VDGGCYGGSGGGERLMGRLLRGDFIVYGNCVERDGIDCTMRILDRWKQIARFVAWDGRANGVVVGDMVCLDWLGFLVVLVLALALAVLLFWCFIFYSTRRLWD
jgi:hypothetical protein